MTRINLTDDDLTANRKGLLNDDQRQTLRWQRLLWALGTAGLGGVLLGLLAILVVKSIWPVFASRGELFLAVPVLLYWLWLLRHMPGNWRRVNHDFRDCLVSTVDGPVQIGVDFGTGLIRSAHYQVRIGEHTFDVSKEQQRLFNSGQTYRIYYTSHSKQFLGALLLPGSTKNMGVQFRLMESLSKNEQEILGLIAAGMTNQQIADQLSFSVNTIKMYVSQIYRKLGVSRRTQAVARARELSLHETTHS
jgi:DNA-binding CsgD family transcriptional regulator